MKKGPDKSQKRAAKSYTIGRRGFAKISEVEGVRLSASMGEDFREFDRRGYSPEERRKAITRKYGNVR